MTATTSSARLAAKDQLLRTAMRADAVLSGVTGAAIVVLAGPLAGLTGVSRTIEFIAGVGCILYGLVVWTLAARTDVRGPGIGVLTANSVGAVLALGVVLTGVAPLTGAGVAVVLGLSAYMALFADLQYLGVRRLRA